MEREEKPEFNWTSLDLKSLQVENREKVLLQFLVFGRVSWLSFGHRISGSDAREVYTRIIMAWKSFFNKPGKEHYQTNKRML